MSITPLGGTIYVNQNTPVVSHAHQLEQAKTLLQNYIASEIEKEKQKEIEETRPTEDIKKINPEQEHQKNHKDQEQKQEEEAEEKLRSRSDEQRLTQKNNNHLLDIKV